MVVLRRIVKCLLAAALGLLVAAWIVSIFFEVGGRRTIAYRDWEVFLSRGGLHVDYASSPAPATYLVYQRSARFRFPDDVVGYFQFQTDKDPSRVAFWMTIPLLTIVTLAAPLTLGAFIGYRFQLRQAVAYGSLVAIELGFQSQNGRFPFQPSELGWITAFLATLFVLLAYLARLRRKKAS